MLVDLTIIWAAADNFWTGKENETSVIIVSERKEKVEDRLQIWPCCWCSCDNVFGEGSRLKTCVQVDSNWVDISSKGGGKEASTVTKGGPSHLHSYKVMIRGWIGRRWRLVLSVKRLSKVGSYRLNAPVGIPQLGSFWVRLNSKHYLILSR